MTLSSEGVPPKAGRPESWLTTRADDRVSPATDHCAPTVGLCDISIRGATVQAPARRSSPNQDTISDTRRRLGQSAVR